MVIHYRVTKRQRIENRSSRALFLPFPTLQYISISSQYRLHDTRARIVPSWNDFTFAHLSSLKKCILPTQTRPTLKRHSPPSYKQAQTMELIFKCHNYCPLLLLSLLPSLRRSLFWFSTTNDLQCPPPPPLPPLPPTASGSGIHEVTWVSSYLDVLGPVGVLERVVRVIKEHMRRIDIGDHHQPASPFE